MHLRLVHVIGSNLPFFALCKVTDEDDAFFGLRSDSEHRF